MFLLFIFFANISAQLSVFPFIKNGRKIVDIGYTRFLISNEENDDIKNYKIDFGDSSEIKDVENSTAKHEYDFPGKKTVAVTILNKSGFAIGHAQKRINVHHLQEFYTFAISGPLEGIKNELEIPENISSDEKSSKYSSLRYNAIPLPPNTSYWRLQISQSEEASPNLTSYYIESGLVPRIVVSNTSIDIKVVKSALKDMWIVQINAQETEPVSATAQFEIYSSNLLLNPAGCFLYFTTRVFWEAEYAEEKSNFPKENVRISPVSIAPNSGVYVYNGSIFMSDNSYTTFHRLRFEGHLEDNFTEAVFCTICFACIANNKILYRNYFVNDTLSTIPDHPTDASDIHIYSIDSDDIPRERSTSDIYDTAGPFFASYKNKEDGYFYILRFDNMTRKVKLELDNSNNNNEITSVVYVTAIANINSIVAVVMDDKNFSSVLNINLETKEIKKVYTFPDNVTIIGSYLHPSTESLVSYSADQVFISYDSGETQFSVGKIKNGVNSINSRHATDELYILDGDSNFYVLFGERQVMKKIESYTGFEGLAVAVDSSDTVYLLSPDEKVGNHAIPIESYIDCFVLDDYEEEKYTPKITYAIDNSYTFAPNDGNPYYFKSLSLFSRDGTEECRFDEQWTCKRLYPGEIFEEPKKAKIKSLKRINNNNNNNNNNENDEYEIEFEDPSYIKPEDIGKTIIINEILAIFSITNVTNVTKMIRTSNTISFSDGALDDSEATIQLIDFRQEFIKQVKGVSLIGNSSIYDLTYELDDLNFNSKSVGMIFESEAIDFLGLIYSVVDYDTVKVILLKQFVNNPKSIENEYFTFRPPRQLTEEDEQGRGISIEENFSISPQSRREWLLQFSLCNGEIQSDGSSTVFQNLPVLYLTPDADTKVEIALPSSSGEVQTRFSQPSLIKSTVNITNQNFEYTFKLSNSSIPFTRIISLYKSGSPRCQSISIIGASPLCPPNQRLVVTVEEKNSNNNENSIVNLMTNYRPPSVEGNKIGLSSHIYNRDPQDPNIMNSRLKMSREDRRPVPNRCKDANSTAGCHCERAELYKMNSDDSDCLTTAVSHRFFDEFQPSVYLQAYSKGRWVVIDRAPKVLVKDVNDRAPLCVGTTCGDTWIPFQTGESIYLRGIELWHLQFKMSDECAVSAFYMLYVENPPLMRNMIYLIQSISAVAIGIFLWIMMFIVTSVKRKKRILKKKSS